jgi:hypothetical protein
MPRARLDWLLANSLNFFCLLATILSGVRAISYRCEGDQVLIVQSFGNDTIRMHCQRLQLCGNKATVG